jgi:hypothetical protein
MRAPKINAKKLAAALAPLALAGAVMAPTAAADTPPSADSPGAPAPAKVEFSKGFPINNRSRHAIELINATGDFEGRPADGSVLKPGESTRFEVTWFFFKDNLATAHFAILNNAGAQIGTFDAGMYIAHGMGTSTGSSCSTSIGKCDPENGIDGRDDPYPITLLDSGPMSGF